MDQDVVTKRQVTIISTIGEKKKVIEYDGTEWEGLKAALKAEGYSNLDKMKCVESINRHTLEHPQAKLPASKFTLYLMPMESKAGAKEKVAIDRKALYAQVKGFIAADEKKAKKFFTKDGKNYTQIGSEDLQKLVNRYTGPSATPADKTAKASNKVGTAKAGPAKKEIAQPSNNTAKLQEEEEDQPLVSIEEFAKGMPGVDMQKIRRGY